VASEARRLKARNLSLISPIPQRPIDGGKRMGFGRGLLLWLLGIPLPIIILLAIFWHN
jgi:hypothetical protein